MPFIKPFPRNSSATIYARLSITGAFHQLSDGLALIDQLKN